MGPCGWKLTWMKKLNTVGLLERSLVELVTHVVEQVAAEHG